MNPTHIYSCDWGTVATKRWLGEANLRRDKTYNARVPRLVGDVTRLIPSIRHEIGSHGCALIGFDFPIGLPFQYARLAGIENFKSFLMELGAGTWANFLDCARLPAEISLHRPFYPFKPGGTKQAHLLEALGLQEIDDLRRRCEKKRVGRRAACALFWTLGANQVGKGAITGWRDVIAPALRSGDPVFLWPFDGPLEDLLRPSRIVIVETYPAECYDWFFAGPIKGKGKQDVRRKVGGELLGWAESTGVELDLRLVRTIEDGFADGDDPFDALVGLFGMLAVVIGRPTGEPSGDQIGKLEGWIFGQNPG
jgi:hypothetical protein